MHATSGLGARVVETDWMDPENLGDEEQPSMGWTSETA